MAKREILVDGKPIDWEKDSFPMDSWYKPDIVWKTTPLNTSDREFQIAQECALKLGLTENLVFLVVLDESNPDNPVMAVRRIEYVNNTTEIELIVTEGLYTRLDDEQLRALLLHEFGHMIEPENVKQAQAVLEEAEKSGVKLTQGVYDSLESNNNIRAAIDILHGSEIRADFVAARLESSQAMAASLDTLREVQNDDPDRWCSSHPSDNERRVALMAREWALSNQGQVTEETEAEIIEDVLGSR